MKRELPLFVAAAAAAVVIAAFFVPHEVASVPAAFLEHCATLLVAVGFVLGGANVFRVNLDAALRRHPDRAYRIVLLVAMTVVLVFGLFVDRSRFQEPGTVSSWLYRNLVATMSAAVFALPAFLLATASLRVLRLRTASALIFAAAAFVVLVGRAPLGDAAARALLDHDGLPHALRAFRPGAVAEWVMAVPQGAARRGIILGAALGVVAMGARVLLGIERAWLGEGD